jgi:hypothetical protein
VACHGETVVVGEGEGGVFEEDEIYGVLKRIAADAEIRPRN